MPEEVTLQQPEATLAEESRVHQTIQITAASPFLVMGNVAAVSLLFSSAQYVVITSYGFIPIVLLGLLLLPMLRSYRKLQHLPRPTRVSKRRIHSIEIHSLLMGLCWVGILVLLFPNLDSHQHIWIVTVTLFLAFGSAPSVSSTPRAAAGFSLPMMFTSWYFSHFAGHYEAVVVITYHGGAIITFAKVLIDNWRLFQTNVQLSIVHQENSNERLKAEQELRHAEAEAVEELRESERNLRRILDTSPIGVGITTSDGTIRFANGRCQEMLTIDPEMIDRSRRRAISAIPGWARRYLPTCLAVAGWTMLRWNY